MGDLGGEDVEWNLKGFFMDREGDLPPALNKFLMEGVGDGLLTLELETDNRLLSPLLDTGAKDSAVLKTSLLSAFSPPPLLVGIVSVDKKK